MFKVQIKRIDDIHWILLAHTELSNVAHELFKNADITLMFTVGNIMVRVLDENNQTLIEKTTVSYK